jgi:hypothetical protein
MLRGAVEHVRTGEWCFFGTYGLLDRIKLAHLQSGERPQVTTVAAALTWIGLRWSAAPAKRPVGPEGRRRRGRALAHHGAVAGRHRGGARERPARSSSAGKGGSHSGRGSQLIAG